MKDTITEFFFFSKEDLRDFHYDTHKFGGLRLFLELAVFLAVKLGIDNSKSGISFFRMCRKFLVEIEGLQAYLSLFLREGYCEFQRQIPG